MGVYPRALPVERPPPGCRHPCHCRGLLQLKSLHRSDLPLRIASKPRRGEGSLLAPRCRLACWKGELMQRAVPVIVVVLVLLVVWYLGAIALNAPFQIDT